MALLGVALLVFFGLWALLSPVLAGGGPLSGCVPACPENVLQIGSRAGARPRAGRRDLLGLAVTVGVLVVYSRRLGAASRPQRRALIAVAVTSLLFLPVFFVYHFARQALGVDPARLETLAWALVVAGSCCRSASWWRCGRRSCSRRARCGGSSSGSSRGRRPSDGATASRRRSTTRGSPSATGIRVGRYREAERRGAGAAGRRLGAGVGARRARCAPGRGDGHRRGARGGPGARPRRRVGHGAGRRERRARGRGAGRPRADRRGGRDRAAAHPARPPRQRAAAPVALRIHLGLAGEDSPAPRAGRSVPARPEVDEALSEVRSIAHGVPRRWRSTASRSRSRSASRVDRRPGAHRGRRDRAARRRRRVHGLLLLPRGAAERREARRAGRRGDDPCSARPTRALSFTIEDDGAGFDVAAVYRGDGMANLAERVRAIGGTIAIESAPGHGTRVAGRVPVGPRAAPAGRGGRPRRRRAFACGRRPGAGARREGAGAGAPGVTRRC